MNDIIMRLSVVETPTEWILLCESPAGGTTSHVSPPFTGPELTSALHEVETSILRSSSKLLTRRSVSPERTALDFGNRLADVLLTGDTRVLFEECRRRARESGVPFRVLLETDGTTVSQIPWEFAVDPRVKDDYLALRLPLARHLRVAAPVPPLHVEPPLRVLGVHAEPHDLPRLDYEREQESLAAAFSSVSSDLVEVTWMPGDSWVDLSDALGDGGWHVLHFVGHGGFDEDMGSGFLELSDDSGASLRVPAARIGAVAAQHADLRLVVLNACESAAGGAGAFSSTAEKLMREGIPAVVAMQYEITDPAALAFAAGFYEALARGKPVDQAVTKAREIVRISQNSLEWATPVLFLASDETRLFDVVRRPAAAPEPTSPPVGPAVATVGATPRPPEEGEGSWTRSVLGRVEKWLSDSPSTPQPPVPGSTDAPTTRGPTVTPPPRTPEPEITEDRSPRSTEAGPPPAPTTLPDLPGIERLAATAPLAGCRHATLGPGDLLAMACTDGTVRAWNVTAGRWASRCELPKGVHALSLTWSPWPRHVASAQDDGTVVVWDLQTEVPVRVLRPAVGGSLASVAFSGSGRWLAVVGTDRSVEVFDAQGQSRRHFVVPAPTSPGVWSGARQTAGPSAFAPGDRHLVVAANDGSVVKLDVQGNAVTRWPHAQPVCALAVSEGRVVTASTDGRLRFWDWSGALVRRHEGQRVDQMTFTTDGRFLLTAAADRRMTRWSADGTPLATATLAGRPVGVGAAAGYIVTGSEAGELETWATGTPGDPERVARA